MRHLTLSLLLLPLFTGACTSTPVGSGGGAPLERIYFLRTESSGERRIWWLDPDAAEPQPVLAPFEGAALEAPVAHATNGLIVYLAPGNVVVLARFDGTVVRIVNNDQDRWQARLSPSGTLVATLRHQFAGPSSLNVTDWQSLADRPVAILRFSAESRLDAWFPGDDSVLVSGWIDGGGPREYDVVHLHDGSATKYGIALAQGSRTLAVSPSGALMAVGGDTSSAGAYRVSVLRTTDRSLVREFDLPHKVGSLAFSPDERRLVHHPASESGQQDDLEILDLVSGARSVLYNDDTAIRDPSWVRVPK